MDSKLSLPLGEFYVSCIHAGSLQVATLAQGTLSTMAADDATQTTPVEITCFHIVLFMYAILFPVRVLHVTWHVKIIIA